MAKFIFRESFDTYNGPNAPVGWRSRWTSFDRGDYTLAAGRFLGSSFRLGAQNSDACFRAFDETASQYTLGFSMKVDGLPGGPSSGSLVKALNQDNARQWGLHVDPDGSVFLNSGANGVRQIQPGCRSGPGVIQPGVWNFFELEIVLHATAGEARLFMNGDPIPVFAATGINTVFTGPGLSRYIDLDTHNQFSGNGVGWFNVDDMYIWDEPVRRGPIRIESLPVNGNGSHQDFTPLTGTDNAAMIDEALPNISDYVIGTAPGQYDEYTMTNLSSSAAAVFEVNLVMLGQQTGSTIRAMALGVQSGAVVSKGSDIYMGSGFARYERRMLLNPDGNVAWTKSSVDNLLLRPEITV